MERSLYISMTGARELMLSQAAHANNLANLNTTGFRADLAQHRAQPVFGDGHPSRVFARSERPDVNLDPGFLRSTGNPMDVALSEGGYIAVQAPDGSEAYTRAGDLRVDVNGMLRTGTGLPVLGNGGPVATPPFESLEVGSDGTITIRPLGQDASSLAEVDRIRMVRPDPANLIKGQDGLLRQKDGTPAELDAAVRLIPGMLETSNVNAVASLVELIAISREFEMQVRAMTTARDDDAASTELMRLS